MSFAVFYHTLSVILGQVFHRPLRLFELEKAEMIPDYLQRKVLSGCKSRNSVSYFWYCSLLYFWIAPLGKPSFTTENRGRSMTPNLSHLHCTWTWLLATKAAFWHQILPDFFHVIPVSYANTRRIKRLKVQTTSNFHQVRERHFKLGYWGQASQDTSHHRQPPTRRPTLASPLMQRATERWPPWCKCWPPSSRSARKDFRGRVI